MILDGFELHFDTFWGPDAVQASLGVLWGPLGRQGGPSSCSGSEKLVRWTPSGLPKWGHFGVIFVYIFVGKRINKKYGFFNDFGVDFEWILGPFWMPFGMFFHRFFLSHFRCDSVRILEAFCGSSTLIFAIPSMRKRVFWNSAEFEIWWKNVPKIIKKSMNNDAKIN